MAARSRHYLAKITRLFENTISHGATSLKTTKKEGRPGGRPSNLSGFNNLRYYSPSPSVGVSGSVGSVSPPSPSPEAELSFCSPMVFATGTVIQSVSSQPKP